MTMINFFIISSGFNIFNTFINLYDQGFILNHMRPYIISSIKIIYLYIHILIRCIILSWNTIVSCGLNSALWYTMILTWFIIVYHGISMNINNIYHGVSSQMFCPDRQIIEYHGISWHSNTIYHEVSSQMFCHIRQIIVHHGIRWHSNTIYHDVS